MKVDDMTGIITNSETGEILGTVDLKFHMKSGITNADYIRSMNDGELAEFLKDWVEPCYLCAYRENNTCDDCQKGRLLWLQGKYDEKYF